jgi:hypothetical protein
MKYKKILLLILTNRKESKTTALIHRKNCVPSGFRERKIIEKSGAGDDLKLVVLFSNGQWKKLIAKFANLTII